MTHVSPDPSGSRLADSKRLLLTVYDAGGAPRVQVCRVVADGAGLGVLLRTASPEVRGIRRRRGVLVAASDARGNRVGPQRPARAVVCTAEQAVRYRIALIDKYGLAALLELASSRLTDGHDGTTGIRLAFEGPDVPVIGPAWRPGTSYCPN